MKYAVFTMDIEDWYHLDYIDKSKVNKSYSMLDGLHRYLSILADEEIPSSFFIVGELIDRLAPLLRKPMGQYDIGVHGWQHQRPLTMQLTHFEDEIRKCKTKLEDTLGRLVAGYRAPCFSLDRERLNIVKKTGFKYDSSRILFKDHPLYGVINLDNYNGISSEIFQLDDFFEFQVSTLPLLKKNIPVSGGGYLRIFPWWLMRRFILSYFKNHELYTLYIHPFELSSQSNPSFPPTMSKLSRIRFTLGRHGTQGKLHRLIRLLKKNGYQFTTFASLRSLLLNE